MPLLLLLINLLVDGREFVDANGHFGDPTMILIASRMAECALTRNGEQIIE